MWHSRATRGADTRRARNRALGRFDGADSRRLLFANEYGLHLRPRSGQGSLAVGANPRKAISMECISRVAATEICARRSVAATRLWVIVRQSSVGWHPRLNSAVPTGRNEDPRNKNGILA